MKETRNIAQIWAEGQDKSSQLEWTQILKNWVEQWVQDIIEWDSDDECNTIYKMNYIFWTDSTIELVLTDKLVFKLWVDDVIIFLNDSILNDDIEDQIDKLNLMSITLKEIKTQVFKRTARCINMELNIRKSDEFTNPNSILEKLNNIRIRFKYWKLSRNLSSNIWERIKFLDAILNKLNNAIIFYQSEESWLIDEIIFNEFINWIRENIIHIQAIQVSLSNELKSVNSIIKICWIK